MTGSALSSLMVMTAKAPETSAPSKTAPKSRQTDEDSFSGIFQEKMRDAAKTPQRAVRDSAGKPLSVAAKNDAVQNEKPEEKAEVSTKKTDESTKSSETDGQEKPAVAKTDDQNSSGTKKDDVKGVKEPNDVISQLATLLQSLFSKLENLTSDQTGETADSGNISTDQTVSVNPLDAVKTLLDGNMDKIKELLDKLQPAAGDTELQKLVDQLQTLVAKAGQTANSVVTDGNGKMTVKVEGAQADPTALIAQLRNQTREIVDKLKAKLSETTGQAEQTTEAADSAAVLPKKTADTGTDAQTNSDSEVNPEETKTESKTQGETDDNSIKADVSSKTQVSDKTEVRSKADESAKVQVKSELPQGQGLQDRAVLDVQTQKVDPAVDIKADKTDFRLTEKPLSQTVANQVTMKMKLMAGDNKQEMEVSLKPDYLGKLTLKITHERGEILAKITAENEQVKAILESNMQLLKDSLEKSGFTVQSLNVSVGNGNTGGQTQQQDSGKGGQSGERLVKSADPIKSTSAARILFNQGMEQGSSSIDLTA